MSENLRYFLRGTFYLAVGALILHSLDAMVRFDQNSGVRLKAWFHKKLGQSVPDRELWAAGTPRGFRSSRIVFRVVGVIALLMGLGLVGMSFRGNLR
jgi:hypothetical protein